MPVATTAKKAAARAVARKVAESVGSLAATAASTAAGSPFVRRLFVAQVALLLFMAMALPLLVLGISMSVRPGPEMTEAGRTQGPAADVPEVAVRAYVEASARAKELVPGCTIRPATLAGIYHVESQHGAGRLTPEGVAVPPISGDEIAGPTATDEVERGPGRFTGSTWAAHGLDGSGDSVADPQSIHDAAVTTAVMVCQVTNGEDVASRQVLEKALADLGRRDPGYLDEVLRTVSFYDGLGGL